MQHLGVNFGGISKFELGFFICFCFFCLRNLVWCLEVQWQHFRPPEAYAMCSSHSRS